MTKSQITRVRLSTIYGKDDIILSGYIFCKDGDLQISIPVGNPKDFIENIDTW